MRLVKLEIDTHAGATVARYCTTAQPLATTAAQIMATVPGAVGFRSSLGGRITEEQAIKVYQAQHNDRAAKQFKPPALTTEELLQMLEALLRIPATPAAKL